MNIDNICTINPTIADKVNRFSQEVQDMFLGLRKIIYSVAPTVEEKLWAGIPSYYAGNAFVRLIPFKDHINIEAAANINYGEQLSQYKISPKGMLQLYVGQTIPMEVLTKVFEETLR